MDIDREIQRAQALLQRLIQRRKAEKVGGESPCAPVTQNQSRRSTPGRGRLVVANQVHELMYSNWVMKLLACLYQTQSVVRHGTKAETGWRFFQDTPYVRACFSKLGVEGQNMDSVKAAAMAYRGFSKVTPRGE